MQLPKNLLLILIASALLFVGLIFVRYQQGTKSPPPLPPNRTSLVQPNSQPIFYPLSDYPSRLKIHWYGKLVRPEDREELPCGAPFFGYHTGDDLEVSNQELNRDVPVFSVANGQILKVSWVSGYGGLIVARYTISGQNLTAYFGHLALPSALVKAGDNVFAGQKLANLGQACSQETGGERKHLHFALHKGDALDEWGYVQSFSDLNQWLNPLLFLQTNHAQDPMSRNP